MELKFERLCQPFLLLFTNRCGGAAAAGAPSGRRAGPQQRRRPPPPLLLPWASSSAAGHSPTLPLLPPTPLNCCLLAAPIMPRSYAGRAFEREEEVGAGGQLVCKGIRSMWRQVGVGRWGACIGPFRARKR